jgi:uncharacterized membrane protein
MKTTNEKIERIKQEGYQIDFGTLFNDAFENYKKIALNGGIAFFLILIFFGIIGFVSFFMAMGSENFAESLAGFRVENFSGTGAALYIVGTILFSGLVCPFMAGIIKMAHCAAKKEEVSIGSVFEYYQNVYFGRLFIATVLITLFSNSFSVISELVGYQWLGILVSCIISFLTFLSIPLIIFGDLKPIDAIKGSIIIVSKQPFILLGLLIVSVLFCAIGIIALCVGIFFTMPFLYSMYYCIYDAIIGDEDTDANTTEESAIGWS